MRFSRSEYFYLKHVALPSRKIADYIQWFASEWDDFNRKRCVKETYSKEGLRKQLNWIFFDVEHLHVKYNKKKKKTK